MAYRTWQPHRFARYMADRDDCWETLKLTLVEARLSRDKLLRARKEAMKRGYARTHMKIEIRTWPGDELVEEAISSADKRKTEAIA